MCFSNIPEVVYRPIQDGHAAIVGGAIRSKIEGTLPNDFDVYFFNRRRYELVIMQTGAKIKHYDKNIIIFVIPGDIPIELIYEHKKQSVEECVALADFNIASGCFCRGEFILSQEYIKNIFERKMIFLKTIYPNITIRRLQKYLEYGYSIEKENLERLYQECGIILP